MKQKLLLCGAAVFAVLFLFSGIMLQRQLSDQKQSAEAFDHIADMVVNETKPDAAEQPEETSKPESPPALTAYEKYAAVYEQNPDFVGWISMSLTVTVRFSMRGSLTQSRYRFSHSSPQ